MAKGPHPRKSECDKFDDLLRELRKECIRQGRPFSREAWWWLHAPKRERVKLLLKMGEDCRWITNRDDRWAWKVRYETDMGIKHSAADRRRSDEIIGRRFSELCKELMEPAPSVWPWDRPAARTLNDYVT